MNVKFPHLSVLTWVILALVLLFLLFLVFAGAIGGHTSGGGY